MSDGTKEVPDGSPDDDDDQQQQLSPHHLHQQQQQQQQQQRQLGGGPSPSQRANIGVLVHKYFRQVASHANMEPAKHNELMGVMETLRSKCGAESIRAGVQWIAGLTHDSPEEAANVALCLRSEFAKLPTYTHRLHVLYLVHEAVQQSYITKTQPQSSSSTSAAAAVTQQPPTEAPPHTSGDKDDGGGEEGGGGEGGGEGGRVRRTTMEGRINVNSFFIELYVV
eukprot:GHVU01008312.1.p1 GENE.GHVU01008312.1~~GHVU01008312.1.p1  ORF type:complete len:246 (+),score=83.70 GHVU01008312.1:67-738(+)